MRRTPGAQAARRALRGQALSDTYLLSKPLTLEAGARADGETGRPVLDGGKTGAAQDAGIRQPQALIMASIVEKETALPAERPRVAAVIYNRLKLACRCRWTPPTSTASSAPASTAACWAHGGNLDRHALQHLSPRRAAPPGRSARPAGEPRRRARSGKKRRPLLRRRRQRRPPVHPRTSGTRAQMSRGGGPFRGDKAYHAQMAQRAQKDRNNQIELPRAEKDNPKSCDSFHDPNLGDLLLFFLYLLWTLCPLCLCGEYDSGNNCGNLRVLQLHPMEEARFTGDLTILFEKPRRRRASPSCTSPG